MCIWYFNDLKLFLNPKYCIATFNFSRTFEFKPAAAAKTELVPFINLRVQDSVYNFKHGLERFYRFIFASKGEGFWNAWLTIWAFHV